MTHLHKLCAVISGPTYVDILAQINQSKALADLLEIRLDLLKNPTLDELKQIVSITDIPLLITIRNTAIDQFPFLFELLTYLKPAFIDLEWNCPQIFMRKIRQEWASARLIISYHQFLDTPQELEKIYQQLVSIPADYYKIAIMAHTSLDALQMLAFVKKINLNKQQLIGVSMGEAGQITRILGPILGNPITYAAPHKTAITAPGQLDLSTLCEDYHLKSLNENTAIYGLIGNPVRYSVSHQTHNQVIRQLGLNAIYVKIDLLPDQLSAFFAQSRDLNWQGLSITMPHKERVIPYISNPDQLLAVNTLLRKNDQVLGFNTDGSAAVQALKRRVDFLENQRVILLGAGGVAKAIAKSLYAEGACLIILNRTLEKARDLATIYAGEYGTLDQFGEVARNGYDILINCTSIGREGDRMMIDESALIPNRIVMDLIALPRETALIKAALNRECEVVCGYEIFVNQAVEQFSIWFRLTDEQMVHASIVLQND